MTVRLSDFESAAVLSTMSHFAERERTFTRSDAEAMASGVEVICRALMQPIGASRVSAKGRENAAYVTAEEYDGAVIRVLGAAFMLVNSGKLMTGELLDLDGDDDDEEA